MAEICKWESNTMFDEKLRKIKHYQTHPEMLPFIGTEYSKILLIGESHYIDNINKASSNNKEYYNNNWYDSKLPENFPNKSWFTTRKVIHNFLVLQRGKGHAMFRNPAIEMLKMWDYNITDSDAFNTCAFMNYFQRPASECGESIINTKNDNEIAYKTLEAVIAIIDPHRIVFLSKKAYEAFAKSDNNKYDNVYWVAHPTCSHWSKENGKDKFDTIIKNDKPVIDFPSTPKFERCYIENSVAGKYEIVKRKIFSTKANIQLYPKDENTLTEIVIRKKTSKNKRIDFGYVLDYRFVWAWDYDKKEYIDFDIDDDNEVKELYTEFINLIENL